MIEFGPYMVRPSAITTVTKPDPELCGEIHLALVNGQQLTAKFTGGACAAKFEEIVSAIEAEDTTP